MNFAEALSHEDLADIGTENSERTTVAEPNGYAISDRSPDLETSLNAV